MNVLRFLTCGSVDDGKSTLIGRLLYDSKSLFEDQYDAVKASSARRGEDFVNLALLTDGLRAEREQGITIDVAYRYFATPRRKFILADCPGHVQYTRNMVTGASTADLALLLIDARLGVVEQTRRHSVLTSLLRLPRLVVCVNKMDLVDFDQSRYESIRADFETFVAAAELQFESIDFVPICALDGDNVVETTDRMPWYDGPPLLHLLEEAQIPDDPLTAARFPVQYVIRAHPDFRGYAGRVAAGTLRVGDAIVVQPSGHTSSVTGIWHADTPLESAHAGDSVVVTLAHEIDISRGDLIAAADAPARVDPTPEATVCWLGDSPFVPGRRYLLRQGTRETKAMVTEIVDGLDVNAPARVPQEGLSRNDIARVKLKTMQPLACDPYALSRETGSLILVDEGTGATVAAGMIHG